MTAPIATVSALAAITLFMVLSLVTVHAPAPAQTAHVAAIASTQLNG